MGIWIRSQNKEILLNSDVFAIEEKRYFQKINGRYTIHVDNEKNIYTDWKIIASDFTVGIYSSEEKALKVLNEIEKKIIENNTIVCNEKDWAKYVGIRNCVFQMPDDEE